LTTEPNPFRFGSGQAVRRLEDESLLSGAGRYTDDVTLPEQAHLVFLRSAYPHARIRSIDTSTAASMPGVLRVITGADMAEAGVKPMPGAAGFKRADGSDSASPPRHALAQERARFVGEAVAAVVADTVQQARDAAEAIMVDYEDLPMVVDLVSATADGAPLLCEEATGNVAAEMRHGCSDDATAAFAKAAHVVALDVNNQRVVALTIEPRSVLAARDAETGRLTMRMSTQMPSGVRDSVCAAIGLPKEKVRVVVGDVGGGFGMKTGAYPEDIAVAFAALQVERPVKWVADRSEEFLSSAHGRDIEARAEMALDAEGKILALRIKTLANVGAYATGTGVAIQLLIGPWVQTSVYDIQPSTSTSRRC
jgi:carbon-monoxide dehydrogenase large subunit